MQAQIDQTHTKLRETSSLLTEERRRLIDLQEQVTDRKERAQRIANLRAANKEQRTRLSRISNGMGGMDLDPRQGIKIGEADAGLEINTEIVPLSLQPHQPQDFPLDLRNYLASLPPTAILEARSTAYERNLANLQTQKRTLGTRSSELERKLRRLLALTLHCEEESLDQVVDKLLKAMDSEGRDSLGFSRVRKFLRREKGQG